MRTGPRRRPGTRGVAVAAVLAATLVAGCSRDPMRRIAAPAPAGAIECARRALTERGYAVTGGEADRGFLYLVRPPDSLVAEVMIVEEGGGELRLFAVTRNHRNRYAPPSPQSLADAQAVVIRCAADPIRR